MILSFQEVRNRICNGIQMKGWYTWKIDFERGRIYMCRWWAYPIMRLYWLPRFLRVALYRWLNRIGLMHTPPGNRMVLSDLWRRSKNDC